MSLPVIDQEYLVNFLTKLLNTPSPTGFAEPALALVEKELSQFKQLELFRTRKGALVAKKTLSALPGTCARGRCCVLCGERDL